MEAAGVDTGEGSGPGLCEVALRNIKTGIEIIGTKVMTSCLGNEVGQFGAECNSRESKDWRQLRRTMQSPPEARRLAQSASAAPRVLRPICAMCIWRGMPAIRSRV